MIFLSLDLGTTAGWALGNKETKVHLKSGVLKLKPTRFQSHGQRFFDFKKFLDKIHEDYGLAFCSYEEVRKHIGTDAAHIYGGFVATIQSWCIENSVEYFGVPVGTIKKHITGKGNAGKEDVIESVKKKLNIFPEDHNQADAIALCDYCLYS